MAKVIEPARKKLMEQVLEYWYTVDFLNQGALQTEQTRRDRENYAFAMSHPKQFGMLYRHDDLSEGESILDKIKTLESKIESKRKIEDINQENASSMKPCCHGKVTVYVGSTSRAFLTSQVARLLNCEPPLNPSADYLAWASFQLTNEGKYIHGTFSLSPIVWAVGRILKKEQHSTMYEVLDPDAYKAATDELAPDDMESFVSYNNIRSLADKVFEATIKPISADSEEAESTPSIHYNYSIYRHEDERFKRETDDYYGLSMSFYATDLAGFKSVVSQENWCDNPMWSTLIDYICAPYDMVHEKSRERKDLSISALRDETKSEKTEEYLKEVLSVEKMPLGKWPSRYRPFFMQQVAINIAINTTEPIFSVNGPPGTGKTTLLKEIIADNVVKRAVILSRYDQPNRAFQANEMVIGGTRYYHYSFIPEAKEVSKYGIVVASSNNAAVENISKQIPLSEPLERNLAGTDAPEFDEIKQLFTVEHAPTEHIFRTNFEKEGHPKEPVDLHDIYFSDWASELLRDPCWGLISAPLGKRGNLVNFYKKIINQFYWDFFRDSSFCQNRLANYQQARKQFINQYYLVTELQKKLAKDVAEAEKTGLSVAGFGRDAASCITDLWLNDLASEDLEARTRAQMNVPHTSSRFDREREKLFYSALTMTKEFFLASDCCKANLNMLGMAWDLENYNNMFAKLKPQEKEPFLKKCMASLIQTLQILVPVISTTFASAGRFFKYVNKLDALGTIIVDEAGQATPQMALRLFSKASRAIVVGDPNQIDPVVTDELAFLESTLDQEIGEVYSDKTISVQKIADYLAEYGGMQTDALGVISKKWIGVPLYVHSRCVEPMFSISNRISYGDAMIRITQNPDRELKDTFCYPMSQWIHVSGKEEKPKNHFIKAQGERILQILETAFQKNAEKQDEYSRAAGPDLFIISPFHTAAEGMRQLLANSLGGEYPTLAANRSIVEDWLMDEQNPHIGTVHTFQGREANEVILMLGCDETAKKSANWVNRNIVNVAVSRARFRLYVVGDAKVWDRCEPVMEMKFDLDAFSFDHLAHITEVDILGEDFDIPELPTCEVFESEPKEAKAENETVIEPMRVVTNIQMYSPQFSEDFSEEQLKDFGISSEEDFEKIFTPQIKQLLRTGMHVYLMMKPMAQKLAEDYDASFVGICFCKALELQLKENYLRGLKILVPETVAGGRKLADLEDSRATLGIYSDVTSQKAQALGKQMSLLRNREQDEQWWNCFHDKVQKCKENRNVCCHPGSTYSWKQLEELVALMFKDSIIPKHGLFGKDRILHGLMFETDFRKSIDAVYPSDYIPVSLSKADEGNLVTLPDPNGPEFIKEYTLVNARIRTCPKDGGLLVYKAVPVLKKNGQAKKLNMQYCKYCKKYYISKPALSNTTRLEDYDLVRNQ